MEEIESQRSNIRPQPSDEGEISADIPVETTTANGETSGLRNGIFDSMLQENFYVNISKQHSYGDIVSFSRPNRSDISRIRSATPIGAVRLIVMGPDDDLRSLFKLPIDVFEQRRLASSNFAKFAKLEGSQYFEQELDDLYDWQANEISLFKKLLAYESRDQFCDLEVFDKTFKSLTSEANFMWLPNGPSSMVGTVGSLFHQSNCSVIDEFQVYWYFVIYDALNCTNGSATAKAASMLPTRT